MPAPRKPSIALLAMPETSPSVLYGLYDVLLSVGAVYPDMTAGEPEECLLDVKIVADGEAPFRCFGKVLVEPHAGLDAIAATDVAVVCDIYAPIDAPPRGRYRREIAWLKRMYAQGAVLASVCSGSLVLAEAGLLDGIECAGHWGYRGLFRAHYPKVRFNEESILCFAGENARIITAGGHSSWHDLALHLIARLCGARHAIRTAKIYLFSGHPDGQLPFAAMTRRVQKSDAVIGRCQEWIAENYACANPVAAMAERSGLKPRTFERRFRAATGYRPMDYVHALRIEEAKQLIETEGDGIDGIGAKVGYEDPTFFRRLFKRKAGLTPAAYRRKFAGILAAGEYPRPDLPQHGRGDWVEQRTTESPLPQRAG
jgi:transcriptional regulator GlxA family with amidase domain